MLRSLALPGGSRLEGVGRVFEPGRDLYLPGDILLDYDTADLTTMFKDVAGIQPVTADGDSIALHLDKGQWGGKTLAELRAAQPELAINGDGSNGTTGYTAGAATTMSNVAGRIRGTLTGASNPRVFQAFAGLTVGDWYEFSLTPYKSSGTLAVRFSSDANLGTTSPFGTTIEPTSGVPVRAIVQANATTLYLGALLITSVAGEYVEIDDLSVKHIPGYHRTQATGTSQRKYKTDGTLHWSLYDGSDDGDATPTINWGTDEVAVCAGVTKSSDAAAAVFAEFSANSGTTNATFALLAPGTAADNFYWRSYGTASAFILASGFAAPTTRVVTCQGKIATDLSAIRVNGVQSSAASDQGAGNFGNHILYFGRRGGLSIPFNGREYRTVIRNRLWSDTERAQLETFIAAKSGVTL